MYKIAICGKAGSGKNTLGKLIDKNTSRPGYIISAAFADPVKEMARKMFPKLPKKFFFGPSKYRLEVIPWAIGANGQPLTVRQLLIDLGTQGRAYDPNVWLANFEFRYKKWIQWSNVKGVIVTDTRFRNEFELLKGLGFQQIKIYRKDNVPIIQSNHVTESEQDTIKDSEFDFVIQNDKTIDDLKAKIAAISKQLKH